MKAIIKMIPLSLGATLAFGGVLYICSKADTKEHKIILLVAGASLVLIGFIVLSVLVVNKEIPFSVKKRAALLHDFSKKSNGSIVLLEEKCIEIARASKSCKLWEKLLALMKMRTYADGADFISEGARKGTEVEVLCIYMTCFPNIQVEQSDGDQYRVAMDAIRDLYHKMSALDFKYRDQLIVYTNETYYTKLDQKTFALLVNYMARNGMRLKPLAIYTRELKNDMEELKNKYVDIH